MYDQKYAKWQCASTLRLFSTSLDVLTIHAALPDQCVVQARFIGCKPPERVHYVLCMVDLFLFPHQSRYLSQKTHQITWPPKESLSWREPNEAHETPVQDRLQLLLCTIRHQHPHYAGDADVWRPLPSAWSSWCSVMAAYSRHCLAEQQMASVRPTFGRCG